MTDGPPVGETDSITSGYSVPCTRNPTSGADLPRLRLEDVDEGVPDPAALLLRVADARQVLQEELARVHHPEVDAEVAAEGGLDLVPLVEPEQAVVHEDAGEPVAHRAVHQRRRHRRVHAARESADDPGGADQLPDPGRFRVSMKCPAVQSGVAPQTSKRKALMISPPRAVCATSGWNCTA